MLTIRQEQMELLEAHQLQQFELKTAKGIAKRFPDRFKQVGPERTSLLIRAGIQKAAQHSIKSRDDIEQFACLVFNRGPDFETPKAMAWCREILEDKQLPGGAKVKLICHELEARKL